MSGDLEVIIRKIAMALLDSTKAEKSVAMRVSRRARTVSVRVVVDNKASYKRVFSP